MTYQYSISNDFPLGLENTDNLSKEISQSAIVTALDYISTKGDTIYIKFKATLSTQDKTILDGDTTNPAGGLIADHNIVTPESTAIVSIQEESIPTNGKWKAEAFWILGATGPDVTTTTTLSYDHPITAMNIQYRTIEENVDDQVEMVIFPDYGSGEGVIGVLQQTAATGATGIHVNQAIIDNVCTSDVILLQEGGKEEDLGAIQIIDKANKMLYLKNSTATSFNYTSPTFIKLNRYVMGPYTLGPPDLYLLGGSKIGGSHLPAGHKVKVNYRNMSDTPKRLYVILERLE
jgi:hypothetical protein